MLIDVAASPLDDLYILTKQRPVEPEDGFGYKIMKWNQTYMNAILMSSDAQFWNPMSLSTDHKGNPLVIDYYSNLYILIDSKDWIYLATDIIAIETNLTGTAYTLNSYG